MPLVFTKDQIRHYLKEMGYEELNDKHLDYFIKDLKKLIRHEEKKRKERRRRENEHVKNPADQPIYESTLPESDEEIDKQAAPKNVSEGKEDTPIKIIPGQSPSYPGGQELSGPSSARKSQPTNSMPDFADTSSSSTSEESSLYSSSSEADSHGGALRKYNGQTDPVSLYHFYKCLWNKQKAPGEDRHMQLRWNVRAGTMGKIPCDPCGRKINYLSRVEQKGPSDDRHRQLRWNARGGAVGKISCGVPCTYLSRC